MPGSKNIVGNNIGLIMIYPNPLNPNRYILLNSYINPKVMYSIKKLL